MKDNLKKCSIFLLSFLTYLSLIKMDIIVSYNVLSFLLFVIIVIIYKKSLLKKNDYVNITLTFSIIFSLLSIIGRNMYAYYNVYNVDIWSEIFCLRSVIYLLGLMPLYYSILYYVINFLCSYDNKIDEKYNNKIFIVISMLLMLGVWSIYLLNYYPGTLSPDSIDYILQVIIILFYIFYIWLCFIILALKYLVHQIWEYYLLLYLK